MVTKWLDRFLLFSQFVTLVIAGLITGKMFVSTYVPDVLVDSILEDVIKQLPDNQHKLIYPDSIDVFNEAIRNNLAKDYGTKLRICLVLLASQFVIIFVWIFRYRLDRFS